MNDNPNKLVKFWQELKRRKVVKVIVLYATTAFILIEIVGMIVNPLHLPPWVETFFIILILIGFPIAIIFSWIFDITPEGIEVTVSSHKAGKQNPPVAQKKNVVTNIIIGILIVAVAILAYPQIFKGGNKSDNGPDLEKSIAVLPPINESEDQENIHIINGTMSAIIDNLSLIKDLTVIPRISVEKYRNTTKTLLEIAEELGVSYIVTSDGQKYDDNIRFNIRLVNAKEHKQIWSQPYQRKTADIFVLQQEISDAVATEIKAIVTPDEANRISKLPTKSTEAYEYYLKADELFENTNSVEDYAEVISLIEKALEYDNEFAEAYALYARAYYGLYYYEEEKEEYRDKINFFADKAIVLDPEMEYGYFMKAQFYRINNEYEQALLFLNKALECNPNSGRAIRDLATIHAVYLPDTEKFLEVSLRAIRLDIPAEEMEEKSYNYQKLAISFRYSGFFEEAQKYLDLAREFDPDDFGVMNEKLHLMQDMGDDYHASIDYINDLDLENVRDRRIVWNIAQTYFFMRDYANAKIWYEKAERLNLFNQIRYAYTLSKLGENDMLMETLNNPKQFDNNYNLRLMAAIYSLKGEKELALEQMRLFAQQENFAFWIIRFFKDDPIYDNIRELPEFKKILAEMETKFWKDHDRIKATLEEKRLL